MKPLQGEVVLVQLGMARTVFTLVSTQLSGFVATNFTHNAICITYSFVLLDMTNTRITDSEVFERRYPVLLREFSLRPGSGGAGKHQGGDGVIRDIE